MSDIEKLTEKERADVEEIASRAFAMAEPVAKVLRIHDAQAKRIAEFDRALSEELTENERELLRTELGLGMSHLNDGTAVSNGDVVEKALRIIDVGSRARQRIRDLEAQVLAAETVSKAEYDAMVTQRNAMREELKTARHLLNDALDWLEAQAEGVDGGLIEQIRALPPFRA